MITNIEKNYVPKEWTKVGAPPKGSLPMNRMELYRFCNSDSQNCKDLDRMGRTGVVLVDYELMHLGYEPTNGSQVMKTEDGRICLIVFTPNGSDFYLESEF